MRYNTSIGTEEGYEKRQQIRDTDINTHFQFGISMLVPIFYAVYWECGWEI